MAQYDVIVIGGRTAGLAKLITTARGTIVDGHILGHGAGNMISEITLAMQHGLSAHALGAMIDPYPTYPETAGTT